MMLDTWNSHKLQIIYVPLVILNVVNFLTTSPAVAAVMCTNGANPSGRLGPRNLFVSSYVQKKTAAEKKI